MKISLPIFRQITYISPSAFLSYLNCEYKTYLKRQSGLPYIEEPSGLYAEIGTVFDALVKDYIIKKRGMKVRALDLNITLSKIKNKEALVEGKAAAQLYVKTPLIHKFLSARELYLEQELYCRHGTFSGESHVPILGRIDAIVDGEVIDWKCRGWGSRTSPYPGYCDRYDAQRESGSIMQKLPHDGGAEVEEFCFDWAVQMLFYNWLARRGESSKVYEIHEIARTEQGFTFCKHTGEISEFFNRKVSEMLNQMWEDLTGGFYNSQISIPNPCMETCHKYGNLCEVAQHCEYYAKWSQHGKFSRDNTADEEALHVADTSNFFK